ncbi:MAG: hydantoinase/oxoprolinase family protein [Betaproteobacteria bacterium]|nr:hydantoinase/oxoprolinase family protein [Betaproteobacteria bacterium]
MSSVVGIDIGGTFTDLAAYDPVSKRFFYEKTSSTPAPDEGAVDCLTKLGRAGFKVEAAGILKHGCTVVINSILERRGAKTALVTTDGFRDILEIGRGNRPESFNLFFRRLAPLVPREFRFELQERISAKGEVMVPLDRAQLLRLAADLKAAGIEAIAVCFIHAYRNPLHESEVAQFLKAQGDWFVTTSHELSREFREYERTSTTVVNAFVGPRTSTYVNRFRTGAAKAGFNGRVLLMGSNGGVLTVEDAIQRPVLLIESGPVGGAAGAAELGKITNHPNLIAFDMGGTTAKAVILENGEAAVTPVYYAAGYNRGYPVQAAVLDIVEVGTGGGSIAAVNELGALTVGPRSAGAVPGPVCYSNGGTEPTIIDANLVLGRLHPDRFLGGQIKLDAAAAERSIAVLAARLGEPLHRVAEGIINIATLTMASAVKMTTIERGHDPLDFTMVAYGGAGPLHAAAVAKELGVRKVIIPPHPGHFCAYGMLYANLRYDLVRMFATPLPELDFAEAERHYQTLEDEGKATLSQVGVTLERVNISRYADMRYLGQEHTIKIRLPNTLAGQSAATLHRLFEEGYAKRYGHTSENVAVNIVNLRVVVDGVAERPPVERIRSADKPPRPASRKVNFDGANFIPCNVWQRDELSPGYRIEGPGIIEEAASTTVLPPGTSAALDEFGNIIIDIRS